MLCRLSRGHGSHLIGPRAEYCQFAVHVSISVFRVFVLATCRVIGKGTVFVLSDLFSQVIQSFIDVLELLVETGYQLFDGFDVRVLVLGEIVQLFAQFVHMLGHLLHVAEHGKRITVTERLNRGEIPLPRIDIQGGGA